MSIYIKFTDDNSDSLTHYGVKGMKWKHRKHSSEYEQEMAYNSKVNNFPESHVKEKKIKNRPPGDNSVTGKLKARPNPKYYANKARKKVDRVLKRTKKSVKKSLNKTRRVNVGKSSIEVGRANSTGANGKKRKRYLLTKKNGRPTHYIPF